MDFLFRYFSFMINKQSFGRKMNSFFFIFLSVLLLSNFQSLSFAQTNISRSSPLASLINERAKSALHSKHFSTEGSTNKINGFSINPEETYFGALACARVVSAVLFGAGLFVPQLDKFGKPLKNMALAVYEVEFFLEKKNFKKIYNESSLLPGDIIVWKSISNSNPNHFCSGQGNCHIGIVTDKGIFHNNPASRFPDFDQSSIRDSYRFKIGFRAQN